MTRRRGDAVAPPRRDSLPVLVAVRAEAIREDVLRPLRAAMSPAEAESLSQDRRGWSGLLERLLQDIDVRSTRRLQRELGPDPALPLGPARDEATLDAAASEHDETGFERSCTAGCVALAAAALTRIVPEQPQRARLLALLPAVDPARDGDAALVEAVVLGRREALNRILAVSTGLPPSAIGNALATGNRRGLVALAWKAGSSMHAAWLLQVIAAGIEPERALGAGENGACPLGRAEMAWQLEFMLRAVYG